MYPWKFHPAQPGHVNQKPGGICQLLDLQKFQLCPEDDAHNPSQ